MVDALHTLSDVAIGINPEDVGETLSDTKKLTGFLAALVSANETESNGPATVAKKRVGEFVQTGVKAGVKEATNNETRAEIKELLTDTEFIRTLGESIGLAISRALSETISRGGIELLFDGLNTAIQNTTRLESTKESISKLATTVTKAIQSPEVIGNFTEAITNGLVSLEGNNDFRFAVSNITDFVFDTLVNQGLTTLTETENISRFKNVTEEVVGSAITAIGDNLDRLLDRAFNSTTEFIQKNETQQIAINTATAILSNFINDPGTQQLIRDTVNITLSEAFDQAHTLVDQTLTDTFTKADTFVDETIRKGQQQLPIFLTEAVVTLYILYKLIRIFDQKVMGRCNLDEGNLAGQDVARGTRALNNSDDNGIGGIAGTAVGGTMRELAVNQLDRLDTLTTRATVNVIKTAFEQAATNGNQVHLSTIINTVIDRALAQAATTDNQVHLSTVIDTVVDRALAQAATTGNQVHLSTIINTVIDRALAQAATTDNQVHLSTVIDTVVDRALAQAATTDNQVHLSTVINTLVDRALTQIATDQNLESIRTVISGLSTRLAQDFTDPGTRDIFQNAAQTFVGGILSTEIIPTRNGRPAVTLQTYAEQVGGVLTAANNSQQKAPGAVRFTALGIALATAVLYFYDDPKTQIALIGTGTAIGLAAIASDQILTEKALEALNNALYDPDAIPQL